MPDENDIFDENMSQLLRHAPAAPKLPPERKERILAELKQQLQRAPLPVPKGRSLMIRLARTLPYVAAAAVLVVAVWFLFQQPVESELTPWKVTQGPAVRQQLADGTVIYVKGAAKYAKTGPRRIRLDSGQILLFVARSAKPFVVDTPHGRAEAKGTKFTVAAEDDVTFVAVGQGRVDVGNATGSVMVGAGQQAQMARNTRPRRGPAPRFTHLVNWAREELAGDDPFKADRTEGETHDGSELVAVDPWGQQVRLELRHLKVDVVIENGVARTTIDQTFFNQLPWQIEGTFYFPLPPDASLSRLAMYVNGKLNEGGMVDRQYGRMVYESIVYRRRDPALLEMMEGNVFKMRVFPIFGRKEKKIIISYTQTLPELYNTLRYWLPMEHTNDKAKELSISVCVKGAAGKVEAASSTHSVKVSNVDGDMLIKYSEKNVAPDQDFLLHLTPTDARARGPLCATVVQDGKRFLVVKVRPEAPALAQAPRARQWIVINDVSASRSSVDIRAQAFILGRLLAEADDDDTFALINVDTRVRTWKDELTPVRDPSASGAVAFAEVSAPMGATNILAAFKAAGDIITRTGASNAHIVYLGDGIATDSETAADRLAAAVPAGATFVGVGVGKKVDATFLQAAANRTGGLFTTMNPSEDVTWRAFDMVAALNTPRLVDIEAVFTDATGGVVPVDAYPSTGTLSDGEALTVLGRTDGLMPARMVLKGRAGGENVEHTYDLMPPVEGANYAPRLWASARINHLLREGADKNKAEIVTLSKEYYVVTPFTSLIVLETDADYKKWKVETGRKDHWQLYPAPPKIDVVYEPIKGNAWEGREVPVKGTPGHPQTIDEIVQSVQFRIATPLYGYYQHQRRRMERFGLYALVSGRLPAAAWGGVGILPPMPVPDEEDEKLDVGSVIFDSGLMPGGTKGRSWRSSSGRGLWAAGNREALPAGLLLSVGEDRSVSFGLAGGGMGGGGSMGMGLSDILDRDGDGIDLPLLVDGKLFFGRELNGRSRRSILAGAYIGDIDGLNDGKFRLDLLPANQLDPSSLRGEKLMEYSTPLSVGTAGTAVLGGWMYRPAEGKDLLRAGEMGTGGLASLYVAFDQPIIDKQHQTKFSQATFDRWLGDRERIQQYNRRYSGYYGTWGHGRDDGRRMVASWDLYSDYDKMIETTWRIESPSGPAVLKRLQPSPSIPEPTVLPRAKRLMRMPAAYLGAYTRSMGSVPGTLGAWTVDRILPAREKILAMTDTKARNAALAAIDTFVGKLGKTSAATENTGIFWSHQGWQYLPARWDFVQPQVQHLHWSRGMLDVTRYAPGLSSSWADIADEVVAKFGKAPAGKVDPQAARLLAAARKNTPMMKIAYVTKKGKTVFELQAGPEDRFAFTGRTSMVLRQDVVCDGKNVYHVYPALGLASRRSAVRRVAGLRRLAPHLMPPADELARVWNVALAKTDGPLTTIRLTPITPKKTDKAKPAPAKRPELAVLCTFDGRGFLRRTLWQVDGKTKLTFTAAHADSQITLTWQGAKGKPVEAGYRCEIVEAAGSTFAAPSSDVVVLDMPLRRPAHYEALLKELGNDAKDLDRQMHLRRHLAMAHLQDHSWRAPWGQPAQTWQAMITGLQNRANAGDKTVLLGDATIVGSAGYAPSMAGHLKNLTVPDSYPLWTYWLKMGNASSMKSLAEKHPGTLAGHLAKYMQIQRSGSAKAAIAREMFKEYPASPLLYGAAIYGGQKDHSVWLDLAKMPRWRALALYTGAQYVQNDEIAEAFEDYHKKLIERGWEVPISSKLAAALKRDPTRWQRVMKRWSDAVGKSRNPGAMLRLAEFAWAYGEKAIAETALADAEKLVAKAAPLTWRLARAQAMWAMGRYGEALADQEAVLAGLKACGVKPSPALLAASARLAQRAGKADRAIDLELAAITAERPYMPKRINVHLFRQRYQWLWGQLTTRVHQQAQKTKANPSDAEARGALTAALDQAVEVWRTWSRVDTANSATLHQQLATLYRSAGDEGEAWRVVSTIIDRKPKDGASYYHVGQWYHGGGHKDAAQQWYGKAYKVEPTNGDWIWHRAELLRGMGRTDQARELYQEMAAKKWQPRFQHYTNRAQQRLK